MRLAEERGEIRGDGIAKLADLAAAITGQQVAVFGEGAQVQHAKAPRQPSIHELAFLVREIDARDLLDELAQSFEIFVAEFELTHPGGRKRFAELVGYHGGDLSEQLNAALVGMQRRNAGAPSGARQQQV